METMLEIAIETQALDEFVKHAERYIEKMRQTKQPIILTVNGKAAVVLQDAESYQAMAARREYDLTVAAINEALADFDDRENWTTHEEVFAELRENNGIK